MPLLTDTLKTAVPNFPMTELVGREDVRKAAASRRTPKFAVLPGEYANKGAEGSQERSSYSEL